MALTSSSIDTALSRVSFSVKKLGFLTIRGTIADIQGNITFDENDLGNSSFHVSLGSISIDTGNAKRDEHLKSKDFFYVKEFPKISFQSTSIRKEKQDFVVNGKLTLLQQTKDISIPFTYQSGIFKGDFSINRLDYDLGEKFPTIVVGKIVQIIIHSKINLEHV